ncbi:MAG: tRNA 2-thiouridine(34) synthase MnmA [Candidatus Thiosymbion ectosymbiont of Robbea hypermnestra]|nr:tRNA 2-thiouridine(34) synthase MnmA [Candidatus Thiosymbion ectosymbiont of Robbea hypermnestra]
MPRNIPISLSRATVMVGLSGGVDSSVAALLLLEQGYRVEGLFMKNWEEDDTADYCAAAADLEDAGQVAHRLGIPLHKVNFATEYWDRVFSLFLAEYRAARTPNPDILCNREIKFRAFLDHASDLGAACIATGHYARLAHDHAGYHLRLAADQEKDQTYFLYLLGQHQLARCRFPLGDLRKTQVRALARRAGLPTAEKKDSTGICFIGERRFRDFLARYLPPDPGPIETPEGKVIGEHQGLAYYTIGQRRGLGIGGVAGQAEAPWFVARKEPARNALILAQGQDHPLLMSRGLDGGPPHWIAAEPPAAPFDCRLRLRHRQTLQDCSLIELRDDFCRVRFARPQRAVTPGQAAVFYRDGECLGGAVIERAWA